MTEEVHKAVTKSAVADGARWKRACLAAFTLFVLCMLGALLVPPGRGNVLTTSTMVVLQDLWLAAGLLALAIAALLASGRSAPPLSLPRHGAALIALLVLAVTYLGRHFVMQDFDLVRDEQLVGFDAWIYGQGRLAWPIPEQWRAFTAALNMTFIYPVPNPVAWVSSYLPGNALLHAAVGRVADPALTNPLLAAGSAALLWSCTRRVMPGDREAATVSLLVLLLSGQFLMAAMTTWAMTAHLFFNLLWLRLFLCDRRTTDLAAILCGAFATGLHQPLFHPMFVAPFLLLLLVERRWSRLLPFAVAYLGIGLFWLRWPQWIEPLLAGPALGAGAAPPPGSYFDRLAGALAGNEAHLPLTAANLLRFIVWGHLLAVPLILAAGATIRRGGLPLALALGLVLPIGVIAVILPWQGYGYGYRYLHPVLGNAALLAGLGWQSLGDLRPRLRAPMVMTSLGMAILIVPAQFVMTHRYVSASVIASRTIDASRADIAILSVRDGLGYANLVYNRPDLSNRPIRLTAELVPDHVRLARMVCQGGGIVAMPANSFFAPGTRFFGVKPFDTADAHLARLRVPYEAAGCRIVVLR